MSYCQTTDVASELPRITIDATTEPTMGEVDGWCEEISAEMDGRLAAAGITVPVTAPPAHARATLWLKRIAVCGVAARVLRALQFGDEPDGRADWYEMKYDGDLGRIESKPALLSDAAGSAPEFGPSTYEPAVTRLGAAW